MVLTGRAGLVAVVLAVVVLAAPAGGATVGIVGGALLAAVVADVLVAGSPAAVRCDRGGAALTRLGEPADVELRLLNTGRRPVRATVRDLWPPSAGARPDRIRLTLRAGRRARAALTLVPTRRGTRSTAGVAVRSVGPLGLAGRQRTLPAPGTLHVLPPFTSRRFLPEKLARLRELDGLVVSPVRGQGTEFDSLRDYVAGDDPRSIDWRATARAGGVVVRTWRPERDRRLMLVLDTGRTSAGRVGDEPRLDAAIDATLLLAALARAAGDRVDLLAYDRRVRAAVSAGPRGDLLDQLVRPLAELESELVESDPVGIVTQVLRRVRRRSLVVLFTGLDRTHVEEGLLPALGPLLDRHLLLVAAVSDPRVAQLARGRGDAEAVYAAAAAVRAATDRRHVVALLRRRGVEVVDAPPDRLAPALADAYLGLKSAGRL